MSLWDAFIDGYERRRKNLLKQIELMEARTPESQNCEDGSPQPLTRLNRPRWTWQNERLLEGISVPSRWAALDRDSKDLIACHVACIVLKKKPEVVKTRLAAAGGGALQDFLKHLGPGTRFAMINKDAFSNTKHKK